MTVLEVWSEVFRMIQGAQWMLGYAQTSGNPLHPGLLYREVPFNENWKVAT